jgi:CheY-like chemotaxis protein
MRVLIIDDEKAIADTLVLILRNAGYDAIAAYDGVTGLQLVSLQYPGVVLCDIIMPGMNGIEVCNRIKAEHPRCEILLSSGQAATNDVIVEARAKGCEWELLAEPVNPRELLSLLASIAATAA